MKKISLASTALLVFCCIAAQSTFAQGPINSPSDGVIDGTHLKEHVPTKRMIHLEPLRQADVIWSKRVWSFIDLRQRGNHLLYYPLDEISRTGEWTRNNARWSLWTVLREHIINGDLTIFSPYNPTILGYGSWDGDQLKYPIKPAPGQDFSSDQDFRKTLTYYLAEIGSETGVACIVEDPEDPRFGEVKTRINDEGIEEIVYEAPDTNWFTSEDIVQYRIKEDYFFDKERSVMDSRIIAIAPVRYTYESVNGVRQVSGMEEMFWLYFPHCRYVLSNYFVYNPSNDDQLISFDDLFLKKMYYKTIYKESNVMDREISEYAFGIEAIHESEDIQEEIRSIEHDIWSF